MSEASFWDYLRILLPKDIHYSRIESDTSCGFPDVHYTLDGHSGTIELKDSKTPRATYPFSGKSGLRPSQCRWIEAELDAKGRVFLALQRNKEVYILEAGPFYEDLHLMTIRQIESESRLMWGKGLAHEGLTKKLYDILISL